MARADWNAFWIRMNQLQVRGDIVVGVAEDLHFKRLEFWPQEWCDELRREIEEGVELRERRERSVEVMEDT